MQKYLLPSSHLLASEELFLLPPLLLLLLPPLFLPPFTLLLLLTLRPEFSVSPLLLELKGKHQASNFYSILACICHHPFTVPAGSASNCLLLKSQ